MTIIRYKRKKFQTMLVNFHQGSDKAYLINCFLFSLSPLTKRTKSIPKFGVLQSVHIRMGQGSKNKSAFKLSVEITLVI